MECDIYLGQTTWFPVFERESQLKAGLETSD